MTITDFLDEWRIIGRDAALRRPAPRAAAQLVVSDVVSRTFRPLCAGGGTLAKNAVPTSVKDPQIGDFLLQPEKNSPFQFSAVKLHTDNFSRHRNANSNPPNAHNASVPGSGTGEVENWMLSISAQSISPDS